MFDGASFTNYQFAGAERLGGRGIVEVGPGDVVWTATKSGLACFDGEKWRLFDENDGLGHRASDIHIDAAGTVWAAMDTGLYSFDGERWHRTEGLPYEMTTAVTHDDAGNFFVATEQWVYGKAAAAAEDGSGKPVTSPVVGSRGAVSRFDGESWVSYYLFGEDPHQYARTLCASGDTLFIVKSNTVDAISISTMQPVGGEADWRGLTCDTIYGDRAGPVWFCSWQGLFRLDGGELTQYPMNDGMAHACVNDMAFDPDGDVWIATNGGVSCFDGVSWRSWFAGEDGLFAEKAVSIAAGADGSIWVSHYNGMSMFDGSRWHTEADPRIASEIAAAPDGDVWVGAMKGSRILRCRNGSFREFTIPGDNWHNPIYDIEFGDDGSVWFATHATGIVRLATPGGIPAWEFISTAEGLPDERVYRLAFDRDGTLWAATHEGLVHLAGPSWEIMRTPTRFFNAVEIAPDGTVWAGSSGGLVRRDGEEWRVYTQADGLVDNPVDELAISPAGAVWTAYSFVPIGGGLTRFVPESGVLVEDGEYGPEPRIIARAYPNPFNPATTIRYTLPAAGHVTLGVYTVSGQLVDILVDGFLPSGGHEALFDSRGRASGIYLYRLRAGRNTAAGKILLVK